MKLFIFDMGGVVVDNFNVRPKIAEFFGKDESFFKDKKFHELFNLIMAGKISEENFWIEFCDIAKLENKGNIWGKFFKPILKKDTINLIKDLKKNYRVICGTNTLQAHYNIHKNNGDYDVFDYVYASHIIHLVKPDKEFFKYILNEENIEAKDVFFIDDYEENVQSASEIGIKAIHFDNAKNVRLKLKEFI
ncbi:putative hydrolase of the HAD superfamily [Oceanotoga teriensis]|uniref:Hydrolase of the HAD superfamily n=1 Tax=Oceanotoga teriensis TaxID=515440 RepID=A0AA45HHU4_9BACT|nr:HAD family phosphatase [Oceanotoga teriensis]PWJ87899.1 putative hydrolase of the HAD superfamily [Oceanotoga teriensis]